MRAIGRVAPLRQARTRAPSVPCVCVRAFCLRLLPEWRCHVDTDVCSGCAPGERAVYHPGYYGAFVLDPDGHNVELVNHNR